MLKPSLLLCLAILSTTMCEQPIEEPVDLSFATDLKHLEHVEDLLVLRHGDSRLAVSPSCHARVFTSSVAGDDGQSIGWYDREAIAKSQHLGQLNSVGGESRLWISPDFGPYSFFFEPGVEQTGDHVRAPIALRSPHFELIDRTDHSLTVAGQYGLPNAAGHTIRLDIERCITLDNKPPIPSSELSGTDYLSYVATTDATNIGESLHPDQGLFSLWELSCYEGHEDDLIIIPAPDTIGLSQINSYFSSAADRMMLIDGSIVYRADAAGMNKIGLSAAWCTGVFGAYCPTQDRLTIVHYDVDPQSSYMNTHPEMDDPYAGDVINVFNGEENDTLGYDWPFYEMETTGRALPLDSGESVSHRHRTTHIIGDMDRLDSISRAVLRSSLHTVTQRMNL